MNRILQFAKKLVQRLRHNLLLKILAVIFGIFVWALVMEETNPLRLKVIPVEVTVLNQTRMQESGLVLAEGNPDTWTVNVTLEINQSDYSLVTAEQLRAYVDLSAVQEAGTDIPLRVQVETDKGSLRSVSPSMLDFDIDAWTSQEVPVVLKVQGEPTLGYWQGPSTVSPETVTVEGPSRELAALSEARVNVSVQDSDTGYHGLHAIELLDAEGNSLSGSRLKLSQLTASVNVEVLPTLELPIGDTSNPDNPWAVALLGNPAEHYTVDSVEVYPATVKVAAPADILAKLEAISLSPVDVEGIAGYKRVNSQLLLPTGCYLVSDTDYWTVFIVAKERETLADWTVNNITVTGQKEGWDYTLLFNTVRLILQSKASELKNMGQEDIVATVNVSNLSPGQQNATVVVSVPDNVSVVESTPVTVPIYVQDPGGEPIS